MMNSNNNKKDGVSIAKVYDQIAESFNSKRKYPWKEVEQYINDLPSNNLVLDLGCGNGRYSRLLVSHGCETVSIDVSFKILHIALKNELKDYRANHKGLINIDGQKMPFKENVFDNILMIAVIHHLDTHDKRETLLQELYRILKPGGNAFISCWLKSHPRFNKEDLKTEIKLGKKEIHVPWTLSDGRKILRYYYFFDFEELTFLMENVKLIVLESKISNHNLFLNVMKKL